MRLRRATEADLDRLFDLEACSYPPGEAASRETFSYRLRHAGEYFTLTADEDGRLVGLVCGTLATGNQLTTQCMREHVPAGTSLCIHSVVVDPALRRGGVGRDMVASYVERHRDAPEVERLLLICKQHLIAFYAGTGFELIGPSVVVHGQDPWFEMRLDYA